MKLIHKIEYYTGTSRDNIKENFITKNADYILSADKDSLQTVRTIVLIL